MPIVFHGLNDFNLIPLLAVPMSLAISVLLQNNVNDGLPLGVHFGVLSPITTPPRDCK